MTTSSIVSVDVADLTAIGPESYHRWQKTLPEGEAVRLGRAPRHGWKVAWDYHISREHADLTWENGQLLVECLDTARNPVHVNDRRGKLFWLKIGESFRIGETQFLLSDSIREPTSIREITLDGDQSGDNAADASRRLEYVMRLPGIISKTRTDEDLAEQLTVLLLEALPHVRAAATIRFECLDDVEAGTRSMIHWDSRETGIVPFAPSKKLIRAAVHQGKGVLHFFQPSPPAGLEYTVSAGLDWAICTPISTKGPDYWCLYVAGATRSRARQDDLQSDLRFTTLMAQFIGSIHQVRQLEKIHAGMSKFFSPTVVETISGVSGAELTVPRVCDITVLFCDVRGFSQMTERSSADLFPLLNQISEALGVMTKNIVKYDGVIADFQGDAALGFWGWPLEPDDGVMPACRAALGIVEGFRKTDNDASHPLSGVRIGIGLAHGRGIAGRIGSDEQVKVGVFGPRVNLGSRLQGMSKQLGVSILMDEATAAQARLELCPEEGRCRRLGQFIPVGMTTAVEVTELVSPAGEGKQLTDEQIVAFEETLDLFAAGDWTQARRRFENLPKSDGPCTFFLELIAQYNEIPPEGWNGIVALSEK